MSDITPEVILQLIEEMALGQDVRYDLADACRVTQLPEDELRHIWRSLGFPELTPGEPVFSDVDLANLTAVGELLRSGMVSPEVLYGMTRVIGSSMARVASAMIDAVSARDEVSVNADTDRAALFGGADPDARFMPLFPAVLEQVWRRHLQVAARRRLVRSEGEGGHGLVVGFADLVGFTALAQQVTDAELAEVVDDFERMAYDVVVAGGGRVVKMIGDEVMFLVEDPEMAAEIALGLANASREAAGLGDVRVGMALGSVVEREGDAFGTTVNLASRATAIAYPGTVVVSPELRDALADNAGYGFRNMRPRFLKHIGRVTLSVLRHADDAPASIRDSIDERRRQMRAAIQERAAASLRPRAEP